MLVFIMSVEAGDWHLAVGSHRLYFVPTPLKEARAIARFEKKIMSSINEFRSSLFVPRDLVPVLCGLLFLASLKLKQICPSRRSGSISFTACTGVLLFSVMLHFPLFFLASIH